MACDARIVYVVIHLGYAGSATLQCILIALLDTGSSLVIALARDAAFALC